jgi:hypothetical protein
MKKKISSKPEEVIAIFVAAFVGQMIQNTRSFVDVASWLGVEKNIGISLLAIIIGFLAGGILLLLLRMLLKIWK